MGVALLSGIAFVVHTTPRTPFVPPAPAPSVSGELAIASLTPMPCPPRHLPEGDVCVPLPDLAAPLSGEEPHHDRRSRSATFEVLPRRPERAAEPELYVYPVDGAPLFFRGFDDDNVRPGESPVALELAAERGAPVRALLLDGQEGGAKVVGVGRLIGNTVVTLHRVKNNGTERSYLVVNGHLDALAADVAPGKELAAYEPLGFVGDSGNPGLVSLYVEARLVREEVSLEGATLARLVDPAVSIPTDARNVLKLR